MLKGYFRWSIFFLVISLLFAFSGLVMAENVKEEWRDYAVATEGFTIALPVNWTNLDLDPETIEASIKKVTQENPEMATILNQAEGLVAQGVKFFAFEINSQTATFPTSINVIRQELPMEANLDDLAKLTAKQLDQMSNLESKPTHRRVKTKHLEAEEFSYVMKIKNGKQTVAVSLIQYVMVNQNDLYIITFSTIKTQAAKYAPVFKRILDGFQFVEKTVAVETDAADAGQDELDTAEVTDEAELAATAETDAEQSSDEVAEDEVDVEQDSDEVDEDSDEDSDEESYEETED